MPAPVDPTTADDRDGVPVRRASAWWVLIAGVIGLIASATLLVEKIEMLKDPEFVPSCSINPVLACGSVINTPQASIFGPPNPLIGVVAFCVVIVTGVLAVGRVSLPRWYWMGLTIGTALGVAFVQWLAYQTLYEIGALCPYCMVVWSVTIPLFAVVAPIALQPLADNSVARALYQWRWPLVTLWFTAIVLFILVRFWDYWSTLI
ncbi:vitamin K epoxide reductase family protein [Mycolicibacterium sp.]|uniref:vitamin K epoxide reductase family protein n=1 Tax=Mycolicibacterium sp. TaxID=2320850 RepID=UPI001D400438|nr:vitamin K epoxide reductase family protein [Mycolicibacterium sp.]MCB1289969.1 vitamin K epoxide reductase family protein [Mycobacterium sp.]MCB9408538.1 vitamin K epoxide reductase family protein [Mycolicibacterium sp.]